MSSSTCWRAPASPTSPSTAATTAARGAPRVRPWSSRGSQLLAGRQVAAGFDVVAVGVEHERAVVVLVVVRARAGRAVVLAAGRHRRLVERVDDGAVVGAERDVDVR